ncbi:MAG: transposase [Cyclobacteriaceae bacterium]|nr:transposase [Cyclobacteriaceae bacterium]
MRLLIGALVLFYIHFSGYRVLGQPGATAPVTITDSLDEINFMPYDLTYLIDSTNRLTFDEVVSEINAGSFKMHSSYQNVDFQRNASYWIRLPIRHNASASKLWLLEFYDQTIDNIDAYIPLAGGGYRKMEMGDQRPFSDRFFRHKNFEILIDMKTDSVMVYYFRIQSKEFADLRLALRSVNRFVFYALNEYFLFGTFYGMILIISLYNLLVYLAIREIKNLLYVGYILSVGGYALGLDGIGFQYIWPDKPLWNDYVTGVFLYLLIVFALLFTRKFLSTKANAPILDSLLKSLIIGRTVAFIVLFFYWPQHLPYRNFDIVPLSVIFYTAIKVWQDGYKPARFFVIAYGILFTGFFLRMLVYFNILPFNTASHYSLHFSFALEMLFLTFALGDRIRILKDMRDRALRRIIHQHEMNMQLKDKVNRELEMKVHERTLELDHKNRELEDKNQQLIQQADKINKINAMLDLDNWKLKTSIKEVLNERLQEKTMDYVQFRTLYPDDLSCYRYLDSLKWENGFTCRKCDNDKYFKGHAKFGRRCTRCGYNESITAYTVFRGVKFSIDKAFYLAYLTVIGSKDYTLEALSEKLEISLNTAWSFKSKVQQRIETLTRYGRRPSASSWETVILDAHKSTSIDKKQPSLANE